MNTIAADKSSCVFLPWDTEFFGFRIGRVIANRLTEKSASAILQWVKTEHISCLYFLGSGQDAETLFLTHHLGFRYIDVRLDFECQHEILSARPDQRFIVRPGRRADLGQLQAIARKSHNETRFFKDLRFPPSRAADLYAQWIERDMNVHRVLVAAIAEKPDTLTGYITCQVSSNVQTGRIGLFAVDEAHQGKGIGRMLTLAGVHFLLDAKCQRVKVATQATNIAAQRLYQSTGFRSIEAAVWFHRWSDVT